MSINKNSLLSVNRERILYLIFSASILPRFNKEISKKMNTNRIRPNFAKIAISLVKGAMVQARMIAHFALKTDFFKIKNVCAIKVIFSSILEHPNVSYATARALIAMDRIQMTLTLFVGAFLGLSNLELNA